MKELLELIKAEAISHGSFILASGQLSNYYIDLGKISLTSKGINLISRSIITEFYGGWKKLNAVGGPAYGAIPLAAGIATMLGEYDPKDYVLRTFFSRKERKQHGKKELIEGEVHSGDRVLLLEDVTTTGGSLLKCILELEKIGCDIVDIISVVDREAGAEKLFADRGLPFHPLIKISQVL